MSGISSILSRIWRRPRSDATDNGLSGKTPTNIESPEKAAEQARIRAFINDFLTPIAADGRLDLRNEDTPLLAAFYAYGIDELLIRDKDELEAMFREAIRTAAARGDSPSLATDLVNAWSRISEKSKRISKAEYEKLRYWFRQQAAKPRVDYPFNEQLADSAFGADSIDPHAIKTFYRLFREICPTANNAGESDGEGIQPVSKSIAGRVTTVEFSPLFFDDLKDRFNAEALLLREEEILRAVEPLLMGDKLPGMAFDQCRTSRRNQAVVVRHDALPPDANLWFLGDLHGDLLTLECALNYIRGFDAPGPPMLILLGDLFDDGGFGYEVLLRVFDLIANETGHIALLAGNHDESLGWRDATFTSSVSPSDFTDWLNHNSANATRRRVGELAIEYFKSAPRALFLPDGLLVVHGGVPHSGRWNSIQRMEDLDAPLCLQDFVWNRAHERARTRIPSDLSRGCEFGYEDLHQFLQVGI